MKRRHPLTEAMLGEYEELLSRCQVKKGPGIWLVPGIPQPFVWGLVRGSIYLPVHFVTDRSKSHRSEVIMHEIMHVVRLDALVNVLQIMAQALYFFHPLVWFANTNIRREREKCCDEMVLARVKSSPQQYGSALLDSCMAASKSSKSTPSLAVAGSARNIEERIKTIMKPGRKFYRRPAGITILTVLLLAAFMVPTALVLTAYTDNLNAVETSELTDENHMVSKDGLGGGEAPSNY
ncbi:MAG: M56 family metallopeptidase [Planctomycetes bacterium]|nr:M56 family metallopeptidase [Planctomycetota bacterium]